MTNDNNFKQVSIMVLTNGSGAALICHRRQDHYRRPGMWDLPGGKAEPGESPLQTAVRETSEEVGYCAAPEECTLIGETTSEFPDGNPRVYTAYKAVVDAEWIPTSPSGDFTEFRWVKTPEDLESLPLPPADIWALRRVLDRG